MEEGEPIGSYGDPQSVTIHVYELVNSRLGYLMKDYVKIHAACGSFNGKRFLVVGDKGAGKTTLITRLLFEGMAVHGDEKVLVRGGEVIPLPRKFHLKEGTVPLIPRLGFMWNQEMSYPTLNGGRLCFFDPIDAGFEWEIRWGNVDAIFYLEPNHGKPTEVTGGATWLMTQKLIMQSVDFCENPECQIAELCKIVCTSRHYLIGLGELEGAATAVKGILS